MLLSWKKIDYTSPAGAQGGPGISRSFNWYFGTPYLDMSAAQFAIVSAGAGLTLGDTWWLSSANEAAAGGNCFQCVYAEAALAEGQLVAAAAPAASTVVAGPSTSVIGWTAGGLTVNAETNNWLWITATGATTPQLRRIKSNTATTLTVSQFDYLRPNSPQDADVYDTLATAGDVAVIIRPHHVRVCTASLVPIGVALGAVTINQYTIIQKAGLAAVLSKGDVTIPVVGQPAVPGAAGVMAGSVAAAANLYVGANIIPQAASASASILLPAYVNFTGQ